MSSFKRIKFNKINKRGDELVRRSEGMEVKPGEEVEKEVVAKDVDEGGWGEVVINGKVDIRDGENRDGGVVRGICTRGVAEVRREVNWESFDTMERRVMRLSHLVVLRSIFLFISALKFAVRMNFNL